MRDSVKPMFDKAVSGHIRSVTAGRARVSSARRATIWGVRRRAEDRRALPPALPDPLHKAPVGRFNPGSKSGRRTAAVQNLSELPWQKVARKRLGLRLSFCSFRFEGF